MAQGLRLGLEGAEQQLAGVVLDVDEAVGVAHAPAGRRTPWIGAVMT